MKTNVENDVLNQMDKKLIRLAWDAELIMREADRPVYFLWPTEPRDAAITASIGAIIAANLTSPVIIWQNLNEEA